MPCELLDKDHSFVVQDYGPDGYIGGATLNLQHGLQPGAVISVVTNTSEYNEINVKDIAGNFLLHVVNRIGKNDFGFNSCFDGKWGVEEKLKPIPVHKGIRTVTTLVYETGGYRIFINGDEKIFYKHRSSALPHLLNVTNSQIFKIVYLTTRDVIS